MRFWKKGGGGPERGDESRPRIAPPDLAPVDPDKRVVDYYASGRDPLDRIRKSLTEQFTVGGQLDHGRVDSVMGRIEVARAKKQGN